MLKQPVILVNWQFDISVNFDHDSMIPVEFCFYKRLIMIVCVSSLQALVKLVDHVVVWVKIIFD